MAKLLGALLIVLTCGGCGLRAATQLRREVAQLRCLEQRLGWMLSELRYRRTALPTLLREAAQGADGPLTECFHRAAGEMEQHSCPDARACLRAYLTTAGLFPKSVQTLTLLADSLGELGLPGQLEQLEAARAHCRSGLTELEAAQAGRLRMTQTIGWALGALLAILLL